MIDIHSLVSNQRTWAASVNLANDVDARAATLDRLKNAVDEYEGQLVAALNADLGKSPTEAYMTEIGLVKSALSYMRHNIYSWARKRTVPTPIANFPARSYILREPFGVVLVMVPWNYPVLLSLEPLLGALAAGNTVVLKFSPFAGNTAKVITRMLSSLFKPEYVAVIDDEADFLAPQYDYIFFTGSPATGKLVMKAAAEHLTPLTLELGGKSPCIVHRSADIRLAARRIVFGKFLNCGQTCVAPDYLLVDRVVKDKLVEALRNEIILQYGHQPLKNDNYGKIINNVHFNRLLSLIDCTKVIHGGNSSPESLQIEPTILDGVIPTDAIMQQEIFGPLLPILTFDEISEVEQFVSSRPKPLALYLFADNAKVEKFVTSRLSFGGGCVNDTIMHLASSHLPFGGVGMSGMGYYHGKYSYYTFSRPKSIVSKSPLLDIPIRYQPYSKMKNFFLRLFLK